MMGKKDELSPDEKRYCIEIKEFIKSDAYQKYLKPKLIHMVQEEMPKPNVKGWELKYQYAFIKSEILQGFEQLMYSLVSRYERTIQEERNEEGGIDEA